MLVSHAWLREWVGARLRADELAAKLTMGGLEVRAVAAAGPKLSQQHFIIGRIAARAPHPNAPHLGVCEVETGKRARLQIVCGARNAAVGCKVPVALAGAKLPGGAAPTNTVQTRAVRGVPSAGMLCSATELGLAERSDGVLLLDDAAPPGQSVDAYLDLQDPIFELELTPNRGDCLSIAGVAREVAALTGGAARPPAMPKIRAPIDAQLQIKLHAAAHCPRYVGRVIRNINMRARTPDWMAERLRRCGARSRNVVVDVTNYVMLELGQPMHAFDAEKLHGGIVVRLARPREKLRLLDGKTVTLNDEYCVIADHKKAVALAGIMGGHNSAITAATRHVFFESAFFPAAQMQGRARALGMHTDASHRFERGVDPRLQARAMERATHLLTTLAGGEVGPIVDARAAGAAPKRRPIALPKTEIARILGVSVAAGRVRAGLQRLGMKPAATAHGWRVTPPSWRSDMHSAHDLIEEIGRLHGFDNIAPRPPVAAAGAGVASETRVALDAVKNKLVERGYREAITYSFVSPKIQRLLTGAAGLKLRNPLADNMAVMRRSLWPGLLGAIKTNLNRQRDRARLFEVGRVYQTGKRGAAANANGAARETDQLAAAATGAVWPRQWGETARAVDFFDLKGDLTNVLKLAAPRPISFARGLHPALHPGRSAQLRAGKNIIGHIGQLHPRCQRQLGIEQPVYLFELNLAAVARAAVPQFSARSRYPAVRRDLAVVVARDISARQVLTVARAAAGDWLVDIQLFDIYHFAAPDKNEKSFAFGLTFQAESGNLTARAVDAKIAAVIAALRLKLDARLRAA